MYIDLLFTMQGGRSRQRHSFLVLKRKLIPYVLSVRCIFTFQNAQFLYSSFAAFAESLNVANSFHKMK